MRIDAQVIKARTTISAVLRAHGHEWWTFFVAVDEWHDTARTVARGAYQRMIEASRKDVEHGR